MALRVKGFKQSSNSCCHFGVGEEHLSTIKDLQATEPFTLSFFSRSNSFRDLFYAVLLTETASMFIKIWELIILYIDWMYWRAGHLTTTEGTGGRAFANKNCLQGWAFEQFFQMPRVCLGGGCSRLELTHKIADYSLQSIPIFNPVQSL